MTPPILPLALLPALLGPPVSGPAVPAAAPGLFFREDWKETPPQTPVTQEHVAHPDLIRALRIVLELGDGSWVVGDAVDGESAEWRVREFPLAAVGWRSLDIKTVVEGRAVRDADLSHVLEVGFTDLMRGGGTPASSRLDWIEVYGRPVP